MSKLRFDHAYGKVYEYDEKLKAYVFCGNLLGRTEEEFISDYEKHEEELNSIGD